MIGVFTSATMQVHSKVLRKPRFKLSRCSQYVDIDELFAAKSVLFAGFFDIAYRFGRQLTSAPVFILNKYLIDEWH